jgi:hypothetical protein
MVDWFCTKERAIDQARERAVEVDARLIAVEGADWTVEDLIHVELVSGAYAVEATLADEEGKSARGPMAASKRGRASAAV